jgi:transcriptional regulator with XRE-family HTH domain
MHTGQAIRILRFAKGYSQENIAEMLHISPKTYGLLERNGLDAQGKKLEKIADILEIPVEEIQAFDRKWTNTFTNCSHVFAGNSGGSQHNYMDAESALVQLQKEYDMLALKLQILQVEKEKAEWEVKYWKDIKEK